MGHSVRILFVEDEDDDITIARRELERGGLHFVWQAVTTELALREALASFKPEIALCDYTIPGYSGRAALQLIRHLSPSTPCLFVSGTIGEDLAIACLKEGAFDYLLKSNLRRLGPAVRRALAEARKREHAREIEQSRERLAEVLEASTDLVMMSDSDGCITFVNDAGCRLLGAQRAELIGAKSSTMYSPRSRERVREESMRTALEVGSWQGEVAIAVRDGAAIATSQRVTAHKDAAGKVRFFSTIARDLRDRRAFEARIHQLSHYDTLTGLPNLASMKNVGRGAARRARRDGSGFAVVIVNLDGFRLVDEGFGRALGDEVLRSVSAALSATAREGSTVARIGPDEFLIILDELTEPAPITVLVQRLLDAVATPRRVGRNDLQITASAGIALYPHDGTAFETLLRNASAAMREAKTRTHGGGLRFHSGDVERLAQQRLRLESGLRNAIQHHELVLHYQPQFDIRTGRACGVEALARWFQPDGEAISPEVFIPLAEQTGLIAALGAWVLQDACATVAAWPRPGEPPPILCVNVSAQQICREFTAVVARAVELSRFPPERLELEITESVLIGNAELALDCLAHLKGLGVRIAVDDFGTGYSSLSYLSRLPVDRLKLDKTLIQNMMREPKSAAIVRAVISLGQELGFAVLAEGVETEEQFQTLCAMGCQQVQGYLLARPTSAAEARALLERRWGTRRTFIPRAARPPAVSLHAS